MARSAAGERPPDHRHPDLGNGTPGPRLRFHRMDLYQQPPARPQLPQPSGPAFDRWLRGELSRRYDDALAEPVPEELLRLLREPN